MTVTEHVFEFIKQNPQVASYKVISAFPEEYPRTINKVLRVLIDRKLVTFEWRRRKAPPGAKPYKSFQIYTAVMRKSQNPL